MKGMKFWQIIALVVVVVAVAGGAYGVYGWVTAPESSTLPDNITLRTAALGDIINTVSSSGSIAFPTRESLSFGVAGTIGKLNVQEGQTVKKGQLLAEFDTTSLIPLQKAVAQARVNLKNTEENLENVETPFSATEIADAKTAVDRAEQTLLDAQAKSPLDIADAEYALYKAEKNYYETLNRIPLLTVTWEDVDNARRSWERSKLNLDITKRNSAKTLADAQTAIDKAKDTLAERKAVGDPLEIELKRYEVYAARAALVEAEAKLKKTTLVAPFDGVISSLAVESGDTVAANTAVLEVMDPAIIEVSATIDEIDAPQVKEGQKVNISLSSLPDVAITGAVYSIASTARTQSGVVTYAVSIRFPPPADITLRQGMTATADIVIMEVTNVLLVPNQAITGTDANAAVRVITDGVIQARAVTLGASDGLQTEVKSGLTAGEQVAVTTTTTTRTTTQSATQQRVNQFQGQGIPMGIGGGTAFPR